MRLLLVISKMTHAARARLHSARGNFQKAENEFDRIVDLARRRVLAKQVALGRSELRRIEWSVREAAANCLGSIRDLERRAATSRAGDAGSDGIDLGDRSLSSSSTAARDRALASARKRALGEREKAQRKILAGILDNAEAIAMVEPMSSLPDALRPIANELRAHYNEIKKRSRSQHTALNANALADYWVSWAAVSSLLSGTEMDGKIVKYASKDMREQILRISKLASPQVEEQTASSRWLGYNKPGS